MFRFKKFSLINDGTAFKIGTDAVVLGSSVRLFGTEKRILDVGTGTGIIALMIAQRLSGMGVEDFMVEAIDSDAASASVAKTNFESSPWKGKLAARHAALRDFTAGLYDLIVSNPPYFDCSLPNPDGRLRAARHTSDGGLSWRTLVEFAAGHLAPSGRLVMILPSDVAEKAAAACGSDLEACRILQVRTNPQKPPKRTVTEFCIRGDMGFQTVEPQFLTIQENGAYTPEYVALAKAFHIFM